FFVFVSVVGNLVGAFASLFAGLADRWGRANLVVGGLLVTGLIIAVGLPHAGSKGTYMALFAVLSFVEGIVLVATPALIRDFSPQVGRGMAMGFWTLGPVLGSLVVTEVSSHTLDSHPDWRWQFYVCGIAGLVVFLVVYFATNYGYSPARANGLANWYWITNAIALVVTGVLTDRFRVRKPFMIIGASVSVLGGILFAISATNPDTSYYTIAVY